MILEISLTSNEKTSGVRVKYENYDVRNFVSYLNRGWAEVNIPQCPRIEFPRWHWETITDAYSFLILTYIIYYIYWVEKLLLIHTHSSSSLIYNVEASVALGYIAILNFYTYYRAFVFVIYIKNYKYEKHSKEIFLLPQQCPGRFSFPDLFIRFMCCCCQKRYCARVSSLQISAFTPKSSRKSWSDLVELKTQNKTNIGMQVARIKFYIKSGKSMKAPTP